MVKVDLMTIKVFGLVNIFGSGICSQGSLRWNLNQSPDAWHWQWRQGNGDKSDDLVQITERLLQTRPKLEYN